MLREDTVDLGRRNAAVPLLLAWALAACTSTGAGAPLGGSNNVDSGHAGGDATIPPSPDGSGPATGLGDAGEPSDASPGQDGASSTDGGVVVGEDGGVGTDGGVTPPDGGAADGGLRNVGSCCSAQTTPGCGNAQPRGLRLREGRDVLHDGVGSSVCAHRPAEVLPTNRP